LDRSGDILLRRNGFTLIELLAVVALFALIAAMVAPSIDFGGSRAVRREAEQLGDAVEFARQRAVMTGREHRVVMDLEGGRHRVVWAAPPPPPEPVDPDAPRAPIALVPPAEASGRVEFEPVPGPTGRDHVLDGDVVFVDVRGPEGAIDTGEVILRLGPDGRADPAVIAFADPDGRYFFEVEVEALADAVRVVDAAR
jgi:prepilin-type N-terminal cleavage/methylation domain-containing protein